MVSYNFPAGLRVLLVDDDQTCLKILSKMLRTFHYEVTTCCRAEDALMTLRIHRDGFDVVLSEVHLAEMDGIELLKRIGLEMDLPIILMSADADTSVVMKGVMCGACDYLIKPIKIEELKNIWQHVVRKRKKDDSDEEEEDDHALTANKPVMVWAVEIHQQFVAVVNQLGVTKAVPTEITKLMNVPGLTSEDVAIHLQKYRNYLRRLSSKLDRTAGANCPIIGTHSAASRTISSQGRLGPLAPAANNQLPAHPCHEGISTSTRKDTKLWLGGVKQPLLKEDAGHKEANILHRIGLPAELLESNRLHLGILLLLAAFTFLFMYLRSGLV